MASLYGFAYASKSLSYLRALQKKTRKQIIAKVNALAENPHPPTSKLVQGMLDNEERVYRIRSGDYRIPYVVRAPIIVVLDIDHRKDIYR